MRITRRQLRQIITEEIQRCITEVGRDKTAGPRSELAYAASEHGPTRSTKPLQRAFHKAARQETKREIDPRDAWIYGTRFQGGPGFDLDLARIKNAEIEDVFSHDFPDFSDALISSGEYEHSPGEFRDLTEDEIDHINDNESEWIHKQAHEQWI